MRMRSVSFAPFQRYKAASPADGLHLTPAGGEDEAGREAP
jgi:hypothetical protein